jgi:hypothetical protein
MHRRYHYVGPEEIRRSAIPSGAADVATAADLRLCAGDLPASWNLPTTDRAPVPRVRFPRRISPTGCRRSMTAPTGRGVSEWAEMSGGRSLLFAFAAQGGDAGGESIDGLATSG